MKSPRPIALVLATAALGGCFDEIEELPQLLVPQDVELHWDESFNGRQDGRVALVPVDVMIYDGATGEPLGAVPLDVHTGIGAEIVAPDDVLPVDPGAFEEDGAIVWDAWRDRYFAFPEDAPAPRSSVRTQTDASGLARFYVMADAFPSDDSVVFAPLPVVVSMGITDDTFLLVPR